MFSQGDHILIVDDVEDNLFLLQTLLEGEGYKVETAHNGKAALEKVKASPPALLLLDVMMPDMNGYEVTEYVRQHEEIPHVPIVLITAHDELSMSKGYASGADDFIRKPIDFDELLSRVSLLYSLEDDDSLGKPNADSSFDSFQSDDQEDFDPAFLMRPELEKLRNNHSSQRRVEHRIHATAILSSPEHIA